MPKREKPKKWSDRFGSAMDDKMESFNASITFDKRLLEEEIEISVAHARMLGQDQNHQRKGQQADHGGAKEAFEKGPAGKAQVELVG